ncbi:MAG: hypothetical protein JST87_05205 [Bacteroidetes bacterium]|nr:hypothetical protein [Bacteroidota bacterium]
MSLWTWLSKIFNDVKVKVAPVVVGILNAIQGAEDSGIVDTIAKIIDGAFNTKIAETVNAALKTAVLDAIAAELAITGLPANPTDADIKAFETAIVTAVAGKKAVGVKGKAVIDLGVQVYDIIQKIVAEHIDGSKVTAAEIVIAVEEAYQDWQNDLAQETAAE